MSKEKETQKKTKAKEKKNREPVAKEREEMYQLYAKGATLVEISDITQFSRTTVYKCKKDDDWEGRKEREDKENREIAEVAKELLCKDPQDIRGGTIKEMEMALFLRARRIRQQIQNGDPGDAITAELQKMAAALEKNQTTEGKAKDGGVKKSEIHIKRETIDWNEIIKLSIQARKEYGDNFDEKKFLEDAINASVKKKD